MWFRNFRKEAEETGGEGSAGGTDTSFVDAPAATAAETADDSTESDVNWGGLAEELEADDSGTVEGDEVVVDEPAVPAKVEAPAPAAPVAPVVPAPVAAPAPVVPATPAPTSPPAEAAAPAAAPDYRAWRATREAELATTAYAINEADATALLTEPEVVLPRMAAKLHMDVMENALQAVQAMIPQMMMQVQQHEQLETRAKSLFHQINPDLVDPGIEPVIHQFGTVYRQVNKTASPEEASRAIGNLVRAALNIAPRGVEPPVAPVAPAVPAPFVPLRSGSGGARPVVTDNVFAQMADEMLNDE